MSISRRKRRRQAGIGRRDFLATCCQGASATLLLGNVGGSAPLQAAEFQLHPHYRERMPLDDLLGKTQAGSDDFPAEKHHDPLAAVLMEWSEALKRSPLDIRAIERVLTQGFEGTSLQPGQWKVVRSGGDLEVRRAAFPTQPLLGREDFLRELGLAWRDFSRITSAELQITGIDIRPAGHLAARVRYELVGTGEGFHREQRVGFWDLEWETVSTEAYRLRRWVTTEETRSRSFHPCYVDITKRALGKNPSYAAQLLHGVDYWRTVLDGACGIDIYGHNGISVGDIDDDGFDDLYVCQPAGIPNRLYRNRGDGTFEDITDSSGVGLLDNTACALFADVRNSGRQDLVVVRASGPLLFLNDGGGHFRLKPDAFHFANPPQGTFTGAAMADYDRDGRLDIYFCLYTFYQGTGQYKYPVPYYDAQNGPPNFLLRNNGDATFRDVTTGTGLHKNNTRYSFCCGWGDYNGDGWPDLYVVNDFGGKNLYRNNGDGTFTDVAAQAGVEDIGAGMGVAWLDYDNDGREDLYVADMWTAAGERISREDNFQREANKEVRALYRKHAMGDSLFRNQQGAFEDVTTPAGVRLGRWAWSSDAWDFDHDGYADLYVANGMISGVVREDLNSFFWRRVVAQSPNEAKSSDEYEQGWNAVNELVRADHSWSGFERNVFYANNRDGTFSDVSGAVGLDFLEDGRAFALADFDHDGRQEVFLKNRNAPQLRILRNAMKDLPPAVAFRLRGSKSNLDGIGAAITLETDKGRQSRMLQAGSGFLSQHSKDVFFGLGEAAGLVKATIRWPGGTVQELTDLPANHRIWVDEDAGVTRQEAFRPQTSEIWDSAPRKNETLPDTVETWLLAPVPAPDLAGTIGKWHGEPVLFGFKSGSSESEPLGTGYRTLMLDVQDQKNSDISAVYNIFYRYLFDRHRDLTIPSAFLIDANGDIVKVYQGGVKASDVERDLHLLGTSDRLAMSLPFRGVEKTYEFGRNYLSLGSVFFQRGYPEPAEWAFRRALSDNPESAEAYYGLGSVYLKQQKANEARANFEQALKRRASYPNTVPNAWNNLGLLATRQGRIEEAVSCFSEALRVSPDHFISLENLGNAYRQEKRWEEARQTLERALAIKPADAEANYSLGMVFAQLDDTDRAYDHLTRALRFRPGYPEALNNLGVLYLRTRRRDAAVQTFEQCIKVAPGFDRAYLNLAQVYAIEGNKDKARELLTALLKEHPDHQQAARALAELR